MTAWSTLALPRAAAVTFALLLGACVTINVYFPAAAAEQAADRFIDGVWGEDGAPPDAGEAPADSSGIHSPVAFWLGVLDALVPPVRAQSADIDISTPRANALQQSMRARHARLSPHYSSGAVGLTADGFVEIRDAKAVPLKSRRDVQQLVKAENADRQALYREVARANGRPEWEAQIKATFARRWIERAERGWYYRSSNGWSQR